VFRQIFFHCTTTVVNVVRITSFPYFWIKGLWCNGWKPPLQVLDFKFKSFGQQPSSFSYGFLRWTFCWIFIWENHSKKKMAIGMLSPCNLTPLFQSSCLRKKKKKFGPSFLGRRKIGTTFCPRTLVTSEGEFWGSCKALEFLEVTQMDECVIFFSSFHHSSLCLHSFYNFNFSSI